MKATIAVLFSVLLALTATLAGAQTTQLPVYVDTAEIDGTEIYAFGWNQLNIERNQEFTLKLELFAYEDAENVQIRVTIDGCEFSSTEDISANLGPFDFSENRTYVKKVQLKLPDDVQLDNYKLRVDVSNRNGWRQTQEYDLAIDAPRHAMKITDVTFNPGNTVKAGQSLLGRVRLENKGTKDENDVKVTVSIPALDLFATQYVEEVENSDEQEETEEFFLRLPKCAAPGTYDVKVDAWFNKQHDKTSANTKVVVLENEACQPEPAPVVVVQPPANTTMTEAPAKSSMLRTGLEVVLLVLVALLVVVGLIIGFSRMREE